MKSFLQKDFEAIARSLAKEAPKLSGKTVLMSGGAGFLGSYFINTFRFLNAHVLKNKCRVISLDNHITGSVSGLWKEAERDPAFTFLTADVTKPLEVRLPKKIDYIIHAAGLASPRYYQQFPLETIEAAFLGAKNLLEFARTHKPKSFLFFSSSEVYGDPDADAIPTKETYRGNVSTTGPRACYDESKRLTETLCTVYHKLYDIPIKIVRPFNVYGPGMRVDDYRVIPSFVSSAFTGKPLAVHDQGNQTRTFCYITDATAGFLKVLLNGKNGDIYNVGNDAPEINMVGLATIVHELFDNKPLVKLIAYPASYPADEPKRRCPDLTKIKKELGYQPHVSLREGLQRTIAWYRDIIPLEQHKV